MRPNEILKTICNIQYCFFKKELIEKVIKTLPASKVTIANKLKIVSTEKWDNNLWHFTVRAQTPPGREWLIENYFIDTLVKHDEQYIKKEILIHKPMARFADPMAEKSFKRAVRV